MTIKYLFIKIALCVILYVNIICKFVAAVKSHNSIVGNLSSVPLFSVVHQSGQPLTLTSSGQQYTFYFSNPYDAVSLLTELLQSGINQKRANSWNIKVSTLDSWLDKVVNSKRDGMHHKLVKSSSEANIDNANEFKVYFNSDLKVDGKILLFIDVDDLKNEVDRRFDGGVKYKIINNIESVCLEKLLYGGSGKKIDEYLFVPSKQSLEFISARRK